MHINSAVRACLISLDLQGMRRIWQVVEPALTKLSDENALAFMHLVRTEARSIDVRARYYSHRWLRERGLPSKLPQGMRPMAERVETRIVEGVGIAVAPISGRPRAEAKEIERAIGVKIEEAYADGVRNPEKIRSIIEHERQRLRLRNVTSFRSTREK